MPFSLSQLLGEHCCTGAVELLHKASWSRIWTEHQVDGSAQRCGYHESFITPAKALGTTFTNVKDNLTLGILLSHWLHILQGEKIPLGVFVALTLSSLHFYCKDSLIFYFPCKQRITNSTLSFYLFLHSTPNHLKRLGDLKKMLEKKALTEDGSSISLFLCVPSCAATFKTFEPHCTIINNNAGKQHILSSADHQNITSARIYLRASVNAKQEKFPLFNKSY